MKKFVIFCLTAAILFVGTAPVCFADYSDEVEISAPVAYLVNLDMDNSPVIYDKNSELRCAPAALAKVAACLVLLQNFSGSFDEVVTASYDSIHRLDGTGCTTTGMLSGEQMTVEDLFYCVLVANANDALSVLQDYILEGGESELVQKMNELVSSLGLLNTAFTNPFGFEEDGQYTTARDMAVIFREAMNNSVFEEINSTYYWEVAPTNKYGYIRYLKNTNSLLNSAIADYYYEYTLGGKSGYTEADCCNLVSMASRDGYSYLCVVMAAPVKDSDNDGVDESQAFIDTKTLYKWAFKNIKLRVIVSVSTYCGEIGVLYSSKYDYVGLVPSEDISALVPSSVNESSILVEIDDEYKDVQLRAPINKGDVIATGKIKYADTVLSDVTLVAADDVPFSMVRFFRDSALSVIHSPWIFVVIIALAAVVFLSIRLHGRSVRKKRDEKQVVLGKKTNK